MSAKTMLSNDILSAIDSLGPFIHGEDNFGRASIEGTIDFHAVAEMVLRRGWRLTVDPPDTISKGSDHE